MAALAQTVLVVNKSGKVVKSSKHLVNVFKEAKSAYLEKKAEFKATTYAELEQQRGDKSPRNPPGSSRHSSRSKNRESSKDDTKGHRHSGSAGINRPLVERGYSDSFYANDHARSRRSEHRHSPLTSGEGVIHDFEQGELSRSYSDSNRMALQPSSRRSPRSPTAVDFDDDLAYGEFPPPLPTRLAPEELELREKVSGLNRMLREANCLQHSAKAIIHTLEKNPDQMAAVALTLAEISTLVSKMAPGVLLGLKGTAPAVVALLLSPEFLIAVGLGVGVTVVGLGGYKIIKKIKAKKALAGNAITQNETEEHMDELEDMQDLNRVEAWRRGVSDIEIASIVRSIEGESITPVAVEQLRDEGAISTKEKSSNKEGKSSRRADPSRHRDKSSSSRDKEERKETKQKKDKEPSGLRLLFKRDKDKVVNVL